MCGALFYIFSSYQTTNKRLFNQKDKKIIDWKKQKVTSSYLFLFNFNHLKLTTVSSSDTVNKALLKTSKRQQEYRHKEDRTA